MAFEVWVVPVVYEAEKVSLSVSVVLDCERTDARVARGYLST